MAVTHDQLRPYISEPLSDQQVAELIERHIDPDPRGLGVVDSCLKHTGASVAAIIADLEAEHGNVNQAAEDFSTSTEAILGAVFFYWKHKEIIDAEITVRRSGFTG